MIIKKLSHNQIALSGQYSHRAWIMEVNHERVRLSQNPQQYLEITLDQTLSLAERLFIIWSQLKLNTLDVTNFPYALDLLANEFQYILTSLGQNPYLPAFGDEDSDFEEYFYKACFSNGEFSQTVQRGGETIHCTMEKAGSGKTIKLRCFTPSKYGRAGCDEVVYRTWREQHEIGPLSAEQAMALFE